MRKCVKPVESLVPPALPSSLTEVLNVALTLSRPLLEHIHCLIVTLGAKGILVCGEHEAGSVDLQPRRQKKVRLEETWLHVVKKKTHTHTHSKESEAMYCVWQGKQLCAVHYPALTLPAEETVNVSGAGDRCKKNQQYFQSLLFPRTLFSLVSFSKDTLLSVSITPYLIYQNNFWTFILYTACAHHSPSVALQVP